LFGARIDRVPQIVLFDGQQPEVRVCEKQTKFKKFGPDPFCESSFLFASEYSPSLCWSRASGRQGESSSEWRYHPRLVRRCTPNFSRMWIGSPRVQASKCQKTAFTIRLPFGVEYE
jgi:hypothetical protein